MLIGATGFKQYRTGASGCRSPPLQLSRLKVASYLDDNIYCIGFFSLLILWLLVRTVCIFGKVKWSHSIPIWVPRKMRSMAGVCLIWLFAHPLGLAFLSPRSVETSESLTLWHSASVLTIAVLAFLGLHKNGWDTLNLLRVVFTCFVPCCWTYRADEISMYIQSKKHTLHCWRWSIMTTFSS
jgi:hypothetical protein